MPPKSSPAASKTEYARYLVLVYCVLGHAPFALMSDTMIPEVFPDMKLESCPRRGPCTPTLEATVATIYFEVIFGFVLMFSAVIAIPGKNGPLAAMGAVALTMGKHIIVNGLIPPPPVMVMVAGTAAAIQFAPGEWGKRAFVGFCVLNAFTFVTNPLMVLQLSLIHI